MFRCRISRVYGSKRIPLGLRGILRCVCENSVCSMLSATIAHIFQRRIVIFTQIYYTHRHHHTTSHHILNDMYMLLRCGFFCVCMCMCVHIGTRVQSVSTDHQACVRRVQRSLRATLLRCCAVKKSDPRHTHSRTENIRHIHKSTTVRAHQTCKHREMCDCCCCDRLLLLLFLCRSVARARASVCVYVL